MSNTSPWKGSFVRSDGRTITITDADPDLLFISMVSSQELGMACFAPGIYRSFYVNENTENEKWEFSVYTSMSWEEWTLHGPSDKREDQFVREKNKPHSPVFQDHAAYKRLYRNTNFYYLPICFATSSAKFSSFFSRPSPVSKRTKLLSSMLAPFSFATCATY